MRMRLAGVVLLALLASSGATAPSAGTGTNRDVSPRVYFFFSPESPDGASTARRAHDLARTLAPEGGLMRTVLLMEDFRALSRVNRTPGFLKTLKTLEKLGDGTLDLPLYDTEGLRLARAWRIRTLPAMVVVTNGHAHVYEGASANPTDHARCGR